MHADFVTPAHMFTAACWCLKEVHADISLVETNGFVCTMIMSAEHAHSADMFLVRRALWMIGYETERTVTRLGNIRFKPVPCSPKHPGIEDLENCMILLEQWAGWLDANAERFGDVFADKMCDYREQVQNEIEGNAD